MEEIDLWARPPLDAVHEEPRPQKMAVECLAIVGDESPEGGKQGTDRVQELRLTRKIREEELFNCQVTALSPGCPEEEDDAAGPARKPSGLGVIEDKVFGGACFRRKVPRPDSHAPACKVLPPAVKELAFPLPAGEPRVG